MIIKNGQVFTLKDSGSFEHLTIKTKADEIIGLFSTTESDYASKFNCSANDTDIRTQPSCEDEIIDATDCYVIPGLVDIHFHGAKGYDFSDGTTEAIENICRYELQNGITDICPATMTISEPKTEQVLNAAASFSQWQRSRANTSTSSLSSDFANAIGSTSAFPLSDLIGIHMEGPFISPDKKGAQNPDFILAPNPSLIEKWLTLSGGLIKLMTIAPELPGALECIKQFKDKITFSIGHTTADYATASEAIKAGAAHVTHLYNAMPGLSHRSPGVIGAAADDENCMVELICDGVHVDPAVVRSTFKLFGDDRIILISDSIRAAGMPDGSYTLGGQNVTVQNGTARLEDGTIAGGINSLYGCMVNAVKMGIPLTAAIKAATINPCRSIGMADTLGSIEIGKKAHFVLLDKNDLSIKHIIKGQMYL